jgi:hypothetical protein
MCAPEDVAWLAVTGVPATAAPKADATLLQNITLKKYGVAVTGFGWQDVVLRAIGDTPVLYDHKVVGIEVESIGRVGLLANLTFSNGLKQKMTLRADDFAGTAVGALVLTMPPADLLAVEGIPRAVKSLVEQSFTTVCAGVLFATWASDAIWWPAAGFPAGVFATDGPLGRAFVLPSGNDMRFQMVGQAYIDYWSQLIMAQDSSTSLDVGTAAQRAVQMHLQAVFTSAAVPLPVSVAFKGWPHAAALWNAGCSRNHALPIMAKPFGVTVPVFWASGDASDAPGWVEGAVIVGKGAAESVNDL